MYVALWFYIATMVTVAILHIFNNIWIPAGLVNFIRTGELRAEESYPVYAGVQDAFMQWWYGHNAVAFFLTTPFLGSCITSCPRRRSARCSHTNCPSCTSGRWCSSTSGPVRTTCTTRRCLVGPRSLGMVFSLMLWMPSWGGMINGLLTLRGAWHKVAADPVLKFFVVGVTFYGMSTFEGPLLSSRRSTPQPLHRLDHRPRALRRSGLERPHDLWHALLADAPSLPDGVAQPEAGDGPLLDGTIGIALYVLAIYAAGITQGLMWRAFDETGRLQYPSFIETVVNLIPMYWIRVLGGTLFLAGALVGLYNFVMTWRKRPDRYEDVVHYAPALRSSAEVAESHASGSGFFSGVWHRAWERKPVFFTAAVLIGVSVGSLVEAIPMFLIRANIPTIATVTPYTPLELAGRDIYVAEGCYNCHSQMIRPLYAETVRYGEYSKPGESIYDHPFQWGSRRIGPDLAREGVLNPNAFWHWQHFENPTLITPGSIMPSYAWMQTTKLRFEEIQARVDAMAMLGVPYGELVKEGRAEEHARKQAAEIAFEIESQGGPLSEETQDTRAIALIAYIKRLGTDLYKDPAAVAPEGGAQ
jgi:cytochrome c oxidase cbb3-type subunit I/II